MPVNFAKVLRTLLRKFFCRTPPSNNFLIYSLCCKRMKELTYNLLLLCQLKLFLTYAGSCSLVYFILVYILVYFYFIFFLFSIPLLGFLSLSFISTNFSMAAVLTGCKIHLCICRVQKQPKELFYEKRWNFTKFIGKHQCQSLFLINLQTWSILNMHFKLLISITTGVSNHKT